MLSPQPTPSPCPKVLLFPLSEVFCSLFSQAPTPSSRARDTAQWYGTGLICTRGPEFNHQHSREESLRYVHACVHAHNTHAHWHIHSRVTGAPNLPGALKPPGYLGSYRLTSALFLGDLCKFKGFSHFLVSVCTTCNDTQ